MKKIYGVYPMVAIIAALVFILGLAVIPPTQVEASFGEGQTVTSLVAVAPDFIIGIGSDPPIFGSDQSPANFENAGNIAVDDLMQIDFTNGIDPGGGILSLPRIDEITFDSTMTAATYASTTTIMKDEIGAFSITTGSVAWVLVIVFGFGLLVAASRGRATLATLVTDANDVFMRRARRLQALGA